MFPPMLWKPVAVSFDSNVNCIELLQTGAVAALVVQNSYAMGYLGVEKAWQVLQGEKFDSTALIDTATTIVTDVVICSTRARIA